jgi:hypothetical protein
LTVTGNLFALNHADLDGGGIYNACGGTVQTFGKTSIVANKAVAGGGIHNRGASAAVTLSSQTKIQSNKPANSQVIHANSCL